MLELKGDMRRWESFMSWFSARALFIPRRGRQAATQSCWIVWLSCVLEEISLLWPTQRSMPRYAYLRQLENTLWFMNGPFRLRTWCVCVCACVLLSGSQKERFLKEGTSALQPMPCSWFSLRSENRPSTVLCSWDSLHKDLCIKWKNNQPWPGLDSGHLYGTFWVLI